MSLQTIFEGNTSSAPSISGKMVIGGLVYGQGAAVVAAQPCILDINLSNSSTVVAVPPAVTVADAVFIDTEVYLVSYTLLGSQQVAGAASVLDVIYDPAGQNTVGLISHFVDMSATATGPEALSGQFRLTIAGAGAGTGKLMRFELAGNADTTIAVGSTVVMTRIKGTGFD